MHKYKIWIVPVFIFLILASLVVIEARMYHRSENDYQELKSKQIAIAISQSMSREIEYRLQALKIVAEQQKQKIKIDNFDEFAELLQKEFSGFFAFNFVSPDGVLQVVYPHEANKLAKGKNLLERNDVRPYLLESKKTGEPRMSHRLMTYQQIYAVTVYVPQFNEAGKFLGWFNAVLSIDDCLNKYMQDKNLEGVSVRMHWNHPSESNTLTYGWAEDLKFYSADYKILNQKVVIDLAFKEGPLDIERNRLYVLSFVLVGLLLFIISVLVAQLTFSKIKLVKANQKLALNNNMLSSLSHDIASPITSINLIVSTIIAKYKVDDETNEKLERLFEAINGMLKAVRMLHGYGLGVTKIPVGPVLLHEAVKSAVDIVSGVANSKKINFEISPEIGPSLYVMANADTLCNNVILNVLSNCIKFSPENGSVRIFIEKSDENNLSLAFTDQGAGFTDMGLESFEKSSRIVTKKGTSGEVGTGLGMLQINSLMKICGGSVQLKNAPSGGAMIILNFKKASAQTT